MIAVFDIETDGLYNEVTKAHCISIKVDNEEIKAYTSKPLENSDGDLSEGLQILMGADLLIGHNIINYDIPVLQKLYPDFKYKNVLDTLVVSRLVYPNIGLTDANRKALPQKLKGSHSLKAWGYRLRLLKGEFGEQSDAWHKLTPEMVEYCKRDVEVTNRLYEKLLDRAPEEAIWLEQEFAKIIGRQERYGVYFDVDGAQSLHIDLMREAEAAEEKLFEVFKPLKTWTPKQYPKLAYKQDGNKSQSLLNQEAIGCHYNENGEWGYYKEVQFNPSSRQNIARWLREVYKWKPAEFTENGAVVINDAVLDSLEFPEGKVLAHYFEVKKLIGQLADGNNAWLKMVGKDGRIHGRVNTLGAVSRRCTHSNPNMAQVPSGRSYRGSEARRLFSVPKGKKMVGCDADALELRTLSHYMARFDDGAYGVAVDQGDKDQGTDIHTLNQKSAGLPTRDDAKTFIYAFLYGAGDAKIGEIIGKGAEEGRVLKEKFFKKIPAIKRLVDQVAKVYKETGTLKALDGNPFHIRSAHSALNTLLQGAGALIMKYYLVFLDRNLQKKYRAGKDYEFILNVHDEVQIECSAEFAENIAEIAENSFSDVTDYLKFRIPLRGSAAIGDSWAETH
jgi:DNA polymerase-1